MSRRRRCPAVNHQDTKGRKVWAYRSPLATNTIWALVVKQSIVLKQSIRPGLDCPDRTSGSFNHTLPSFLGTFVPWWFTSSHLILWRLCVLVVNIFAPDSSVSWWLRFAAGFAYTVQIPYLPRVNLSTAHSAGYSISWRDRPGSIMPIIYQRTVQRLTAVVRLCGLGTHDRGGRCISASRFGSVLAHYYWC